MLEKNIKYIVYLLSLAIIIAFFAVIYGMYIKITPKASKNYNINNTISLSLKQNHEIVDIQVIDSNKVLITISNEYGIQGIIFDIDKQKILYKIKK